MGDLIVTHNGEAIAKLKHIEHPNIDYVKEYGEYFNKDSVIDMMVTVKGGFNNPNFREFQEIIKKKNAEQRKINLSFKYRKRATKRSKWHEEPI